MLSHFDQYVLSLIIQQLPSCPSWIVLSTLNRRFHHLIRQTNAFEFTVIDTSIPRCGKRRSKKGYKVQKLLPKQLEAVLCSWQGMKQLRTIDLSHLALQYRYDVHNSLHPLPHTFQTRLSHLQRIVFNTVRRATLETLLLQAPALRSITVLNAMRISGAMRLSSAPQRTTSTSTSTSTSVSSSTTCQVTAIRLTNLERARVNTIVPMLKYVGTHLRVLRLNGSPFLDTKILQCLHQMPSPPQLKELSLAQCQRMEDRDVELFLSKCGSELEWLDLSFCRGVGRTNTMFDFDNNVNNFHLPCLTTVLLDQCVDMEWHFIMRLTVCAPKIEQLSVRGCRINDLAFQVLLQRPRADHVKSLDVSNTQITDDTVQRAMRYMHNLSFFGVEGCRGVPLRTRQRIRGGSLGKDRRQSMYVYIDDEQDYRNARIRHAAAAPSQHSKERSKGLKRQRE